MRPQLALFPAAILLLGGCNPLPKTVQMKGEIRDGLDPEAPPFAGARMSLFEEDGSRIGTDKADADGKFNTEVPAGSLFHLVIDGDGHVPASFTGQSGLDERFSVEDGTLHGMRTEDWDAWSLQFAGCPGVGEGGAVFAEPLVEELRDSEGNHPGVSSAAAEIWDPKSEEVIATACYLDEEGVAYDPDATATGAAGVFAIFGIPEGVFVLSVGLEIYPGSWTWDDSLIYVPEGGVAPRFPAWVHFPVR